MIFTENIPHSYKQKSRKIFPLFLFGIAGLFLAPLIALAGIDSVIIIEKSRKILTLDSAIRFLTKKIEKNCLGKEDRNNLIAERLRRMGTAEHESKFISAHYLLSSARIQDDEAALDTLKEGYFAKDSENQPVFSPLDLHRIENAHNSRVWRMHPELWPFRSPPIRPPHVKPNGGKLTLGRLHFVTKNALVDLSEKLLGEEKFTLLEKLKKLIKEEGLESFYDLSRLELLSPGRKTEIGCLNF